MSGASPRSAEPTTSVRAWVIELDTRYPASTLSASGTGCEIVDGGGAKEAVVVFPHVRHRLVVAAADTARVYSGPAFFPVYCRVQGHRARLSNVAADLIDDGEEVRLETLVLVQQLLGANYPIDGMYADIELLEASAIYDLDQRGLRYVSTSLRQIGGVKQKDALDQLYANFERLMSPGQPIAVPLSAGYDSRFNLAIAMEMSRKFGNSVTLWHEFKEPAEDDVARAVAEKAGLPLHIEDRKAFADRVHDTIFDPAYIRFQSGTYRDNLPRWHAYLDRIRTAVPDATIVGFGAEAHKGKYYDQIPRVQKAKSVLGAKQARLEFVAQRMGLRGFAREYQDRFFDELSEHSAVFPETHSRVDFVHYHTYVANGYGRRCHDFLQFFGVPFPFLDETFLSVVFSLPPAEKKEFKIVRDGIAQLMPKLLEVPFISGNTRALGTKSRRWPLHELRYSRALTTLRLLLLPAKTKGSTALVERERAEIVRGECRSPITRKLKEILLDDLRAVPLVRREFAIQAFLYFRLLETEKGVTIRCV